MSARGPVLTTAALGVVAIAAALGVVLAAGPDDTATAAPSAAVSTAAADTAAPDGLDGRWSGPLRERGGPTVDLRLTVADTRAATLDIPAFGCTYAGTVGPPKPAAPVVVTLRTSTNPQRLCAGRATVRLTPLTARSLRYELLTTCTTGAPCVRHTAAAVLTAP